MQNYFTKFILAGCCTFILSGSTGQYKNLKYKIVHSGDEIGTVCLKKSNDSTGTLFTLNIEARKRIIFLMTVSEKQECRFRDDRLISSHCFRKVNGKVKVNKQFVFTGKGYELRKEGTVEQFPMPEIRNNMLSIYFDEPIGLTKVFSENFQCYLEIKRPGKGEYTILLPDGNQNTYFFENGICTHVKARHSFFTVDLLLCK